MARKTKKTTKKKKLPNQDTDNRIRLPCPDLKIPSFSMATTAYKFQIAAQRFKLPLISDLYRRYSLFIYFHFIPFLCMYIYFPKSASYASLLRNTSQHNRATRNMHAICINTRAACMQCARKYAHIMRATFTHNIYSTRTQHASHNTYATHHAERAAYITQHELYGTQHTARSAAHSTQHTARNNKLF